MQTSGTLKGVRFCSTQRPSCSRRSGRVAWALGVWLLLWALAYAAVPFKATLYRCRTAVPAAAGARARDKKIKAGQPSGNRKRLARTGVTAWCGGQGLPRSQGLQTARVFLGAAKAVLPEGKWTPRAELNLAMP